VVANHQGRQDYGELTGPGTFLTDRVLIVLSEIFIRTPIGTSLLMAGILVFGRITPMRSPGNSCTNETDYLAPPHCKGRSDLRPDKAPADDCKLGPVARGFPCTLEI
jgi:hypothetical protein